MTTNISDIVDVDDFISGPGKCEEEKIGKHLGDATEKTQTERSDYKGGTGGAEAGALLMDDSFAKTTPSEGSNVDEEGEEEEEAEDASDTYHLIIRSGIHTTAFWFAILVFLAQFSILGLVFVDMVQFSFIEEVDEIHGVQKRIDMPVAVSPFVTIGQLLAIFWSVVILANDGDLFTGFTRLLQGYNPDILNYYPAASYWSWLLAGVLQVIEGVMVICVSFVLLMSSSSLLGIVLNVAAIFFVSEIDDISFSVASRGFLGDGMARECKKATRQLPLEKHRYTKQTIAILQRVLLLVVLVGQLIPYAILASWQWNGRFLCHTLDVQFGDAVLPGKFAENFGLAISKIGISHYACPLFSSYRLADSPSSQTWPTSVGAFIQ
mgnify:CR=1 FL=1